MAGCILQWMVHNGSRVFGADASNKTLTLLSDPAMTHALMQVSELDSTWLFVLLDLFFQKRSLFLNWECICGGYVTDLKASDIFASPSPPRYVLLQKRRPNGPRRSLSPLAAPSPLPRQPRSRPRFRTSQRRSSAATCSTTSTSSRRSPREAATAASP